MLTAQQKPPENRAESGALRCPFCGEAGTHAFDARDRNREATNEVFAYARCGACGTIFLVDPPADLARYYQGDYYQFDSAGEPLWKSNPVRIKSASYRIELLLDHLAPGQLAPGHLAPDHLAPGHLIEIGAGTGAFAVAAQAAGFDVTAIDMDARCCQYLSEREGITAICSDHPLAALASLPTARVVALWHVLEHLPNPAEVLEAVAGRLERGGVLAIGVPNLDSLQFGLMKGRWAQIDAPRHLSLVPPRALITRGGELGMHEVAITTNDPEGVDFNLFGWANALRRRPARGATPRHIGLGALAARRALAPLERTGNRGSALTLLLRKER